MPRKLSGFTPLVICAVFIALLLGIPVDIHSYDTTEPVARSVRAHALDNAPAIVPEIEAMSADDPGTGIRAARRRSTGDLDLTDGVPLMPPDMPTPPEFADGESGETLVRTYDFRTGEVYEREFPQVKEFLPSQHTEAGDGLYEWPDNPGADDKNFSDWTLESYPSTGTKAHQVKLISYYTGQNGQVGIGFCSGTLIDPLHVVTAAHCVWAHEHEFVGPVFAEADSIHVIPGFKEGDRPLGTAWAAMIHTWSQWRNFHDYDHDIAVITLNRPIGAITGWWGYGYNEDCNFWEALYWRHAGWPSEAPYDGQQMYRNVGYFDDCDPAGWDNRASWDGPSWGGSSGAGSLRTLTDAVYGVLSTSDREEITEICKITPAKFGHIEQIINTDKPAALDLHCMDVDIDDSCESGARPDTLDFTVVNYSGEARSGDWDFLVYLSNDDFISTADTYVGSGTFSYGFGKRDAVRVTATAPLLPADMPEGDYYAGVILNHADANNFNNASHGYEADVMHVDCPPSDPPNYVGPYNNGQCLPVNIIFDWDAVAGLADYQLQVGTACASGQILEMATTQYTWYGLEYNTTYYWRVRSRAQCGAWGTWGPCWTFTTRPDLTEVVTPISPSNGGICADPSGNVIWTGYPNRQMYEFRIDTRCGEGVVQQTTNNSIPVSLDLGTEYHWSVRVQTDCNGWWTDWSPCYTFTTTPDWVPRPQLISPADNSSCVNSHPLLYWAAEPEHDGYDVQFGTLCGEGTPIPSNDNDFALAGLLDGVTYYWRVRSYVCDVASEWSPCWSFTVDDQEPGPPPNVVADRPIETWSNDNTISVDWDPSPDNCGTPLYSCLFNWYPGTIPDNVPDAEATEFVSEALADRTDHWFHIKAIDNAHNMSPTVHLGPFWIDTTPPSAPDFDYATLDPGIVTGPSLLVIDWLPAVDDASGVAGYSWGVNLAPVIPGNLDDTIDLSEPSLTVEVEQEVDYWFFLKAIDAAGNGGEVAMSGPYTVDHSRFGVAFLWPAGNEILTEGFSYDIQWGIYDDGPAVLDRGRLEYSLDAGATYALIANLTPGEVFARQYSWTASAVSSDEAVFRLTVWDTGENEVSSRSMRCTFVQVSDVPEGPLLADHPTLAANRPNPFNPRTTIEFALPRPASVRLAVYDMSGRLVRHLIDGESRTAGQHKEDWDGRDKNGKAVAAGVYMYRIEADGTTLTRRMTLVK